MRANRAISARTSIEQTSLVRSWGKRRWVHK